jgi:hypothetical protein
MVLLVTCKKSSVQMPPPLAGALARLGSELVALHLLESPKLNKPLTIYTGPPNPEVKRVGWANKAVWLDAPPTPRSATVAPHPGTVGFRSVPEAVWNFHIGGYQVCEKWLKDRKGRKGHKGKKVLKDHKEIKDVMVEMEQKLK